MLVSGATGSGKSYLACALSHRTCRLGISTRYYRVSRILDQLALARGDGCYPKLVQRLAKTSLLVLDDWGLAPLSGQGRHDLLEVLDDRYARRGTILASQLPVEHWHDVVGDPTFGDAILDRLLNNAPSMRRLYDSTKETPTPPTTPDPSMSSTPSRSPLNPGRLGPERVDDSSEYAPTEQRRPTGKACHVTEKRPRGVLLVEWREASPDPHERRGKHL